MLMQSLIANCKLALTNLWHHKVRAILAMIGILVGTASVVALLTGGELATNNALAQFKSLGTNLLAMDINDLNYGSNDDAQKREFQLSDIPELRSASPNITLIAPYISTYSTTSYHAHNLNGSIVGFTSTLPKVLHLGLKQGRLVNQLDVGHSFCDIGNNIAKSLKTYGVLNPIGTQIQVGNAYYTIVGVMANIKPIMFFPTNLNSTILVPLQNTYELTSQANIRNIIMRTKPKTNFATLQTNIKNKMSLMFPKKQVYFISPTQILSVMGKQRQTFTWMLGMIGGIALLVGGIGVMNVMLMCVMERRQEIGIRIAVGATQKNILFMFLFEAVIQTVIGGLVGVLLGILISFFIAEFARWTFNFYIMPPLIGFIVSVIVGLIAGFYPALRASKLDPIVTLRTA